MYSAEKKTLYMMVLLYYYCCTSVYCKLHFNSEYVQGCYI